MKTAIKMTFLNSKQFQSIVYAITTIIVVCLLFLQICYNPQLQIPIKSFGDIFIIPMLVFMILVISTMTVITSFQYYIKSNSREFGLVKMAGYNAKETMIYYTLKIGIIYCISFCVAILSSIVIIPLVQWTVYTVLNIDSNIFFISKQAILETLCIIPLILITISLYQFTFVNLTPISDLLKSSKIQSYRKRENKYGFKIPDTVYMVLYMGGIAIIAIDTELSSGLAIPACIGAVGGYGVLRYVLPKTISEHFTSAAKVKVKDYIVLGDLSQFMQQSRTLICYLMIVLIALPILIINVGYDEKIFIIYNLGLLFLTILLAVSLTSLFMTNLSSKRNHYKELFYLGVTPEEIYQAEKRFINLYYLIFIVLASIYILITYISTINVFTISITRQLLILGECFIPFVISKQVVITNLRRLLNGNNHLWG